MVRTGKNLRPSIAHPYLQDCIWRVRFLSAGVPVSPNLKGLLRVANIYQWNIRFHNIYKVTSINLWHSFDVLIKVVCCFLSFNFGVEMMLGSVLVVDDAWTNEPEYPFGSVYSRPITCTKHWRHFVKSLARFLLCSRCTGIFESQLITFFLNCNREIIAGEIGSFIHACFRLV
jgi:hypothetical protein